MYDMYGMWASLVFFLQTSQKVRDVLVLSVLLSETRIH